MFRRYALADSLSVEREFLPAAVWWKFEPHSNIAPGRYVPAIRLHDKATEGVMMRWGLIPNWAEGEYRRNPAIADIRKIDKSKYFQSPWLEGQRCIIPMAGFYAWQLTEANYRQPYFVHLRDRSVFGVAAIWDRSVRERDDVIESFALISVAANELLQNSSIDSKGPSMPAILRRRDYDVWLNGTPVQAKAALHTFRADWMRRHAVSRESTRPKSTARRCANRLKLPTREPNPAPRHSIRRQRLTALIDRFQLHIEPPQLT